MSEWPNAIPGNPVDPAAPSDAELIEWVLAGDRDWFSVLVARYQASLYRYAVAMVLDHDVAADLVQDSFVRAYVSLRDCRDPRAFRAWIAKTLRHRCFDYFKEARRHDVRLDADRFVDPHEGPDAQLARGQLRAELRNALTRLPSAQREAFVLHCVEGVPYSVIARLTGASPSALKMRVLRAREALSASLGGHQHVTDLALGRLDTRPG